MTAQQLIQQYNLQPHPEGGWYKESYKSNEYISGNALPGRFGGSRSFSTAIYFLLEQGNFSAFHRIKSDECWHFYAGDALSVYVIQMDGKLEIIHLGNDIGKGQLFQYVVPANCWFASRPVTRHVAAFVLLAAPLLQVLILLILNWLVQHLYLHYIRSMKSLLKNCADKIYLPGLLYSI